MATFVGDALRDFARAVPEESARRRLRAVKRVEDELERAVTLERIRLSQESGKRSQATVDLAREKFTADQAEKRRKLLLPDPPKNFSQVRSLAQAKKFAEDPVFRAGVTEADAAKALGVSKEIGQTAVSGVSDVRKQLTAGGKRFETESERRRKEAGFQRITGPEGGIRFEQREFEQPPPVDTARIVAGQRALVRPSQVEAFERSLTAGGIQPEQVSPRTVSRATSPQAPTGQLLSSREGFVGETFEQFFETNKNLFSKADEATIAKLKAAFEADPEKFRRTLARMQ